MRFLLADVKPLHWVPRSIQPDGGCGFACVYYTDGGRCIKAAYENMHASHIMPFSSYTCSTRPWLMPAHHISSFLPILWAAAAGRQRTQQLLVNLLVRPLLLACSAAAVNCSDALSCPVARCTLNHKQLFW